MQFMPIVISAPNIEGTLITSEDQYKLYGYDPALIDDPVVYEEQVLTEGHLPMAIKYDGLSLSVDKNNFISSQEIGKQNFAEIKYTYRILQPYTHVESVPNWGERKDKNGSSVNYLIGYNQVESTRYHWVPIKDLSSLQIQKSKYYIVDIQGNFKADTGDRSIDIVPKVQIGSESREFREYAWWNANWDHRVKVYVMNDYFDTKLNNFPVLINLYDEVGDPMDGGDSIRFIGMDNTTEYDFEIEDWKANDWCWIWVEVPTIYADRNTTFWMYYGNPAAPDGQDKHGTWNSEYMAVWHFNDNSSDSTINNWDLTDINTPTYYDGSKIGGGVSLNGEDTEYFTHATLLDTIPASGEITFMSWHNPDTIANTMYIQRKRSSGDDQIGEAWIAGNAYDFIVETNGAVRAHLDFGALYSANMWQMITHTHEDNDNQEGWYNITKSRDGDGNGVLDDGTNYDFFIGYSGAGNPFYGDFTEARLSSVRRNDSWIKAEYYTCNQSDNATNGSIIQFGAEDNKPVPPVPDVNITITNPYPGNETLGICPCSSHICVTVNNDVGNNMNITFFMREKNSSFGPLWYGQTQFINVSNGTYCFCTESFIADIFAAGRTNATITPLAIDTWYNITFENFTSFGITGNPSEITVPLSGYYTLNYWAACYDNKVAPAGDIIAFRMACDNVEVPGSYRELQFQKQDNIRSEISLAHIYLEAGCKMNFQYIVNDVNIEISEDGTYADYATSTYASITLEQPLQIGKKFNTSYEWYVNVTDYAGNSNETGIYWFYTTQNASDCNFSKGFKDTVSIETWILPVAMMFILIPLVLSKRRN